MVDKVEITKEETTSEKPVEETKSTQSKPEGLPEKFNTVEDLAKSYSELEKKLGEQTPTEEVDPTSKATLKEDAPKETIKKDAPSPKKGTDLSLEGLTKQGNPRQTKDGYIQTYVNKDKTKVFDVYFNKQLDVIDKVPK